MLVPAGRSNSMRQVLTEASEPLVMVTRVSWPVPQSCALTKAAVTLPAPNAEAIGTVAAVTAITAPTQRARRRDLFMWRHPKQLGNFPEDGETLLTASSLRQDVHVSISSGAATDLRGHADGRPGRPRNLGT